MNQNKTSKKKSMQAAIPTVRAGIIAKFFMFTTFVLAAYILVPFELIDGRARPYYESYMERVKRNCNLVYFPKQVIIEFVHFERSTRLGTCHNQPNRLEIKLSEYQWYGLTNEQRYELIAHEMTHCVFQAEHEPWFGHFMYKANQGISTPELEQQIDTYARENCKLF